MVPSGQCVKSCCVSIGQYLTMCEGLLVHYVVHYYWPACQSSVLHTLLHTATLSCMLLSKCTEHYKYQDLTQPEL